MPFYEFPASFVPHEKGFLLDFSCYYNISPLACRTPSPLDRLLFFSFDAPGYLQCKKNENFPPSLAVSDIFVAHPAVKACISAFFFELTELVLLLFPIQSMDKFCLFYPAFWGYFHSCFPKYPQFPQSYPQWHICHFPFSASRFFGIRFSFLF